MSNRATRQPNTFHKSQVRILPFTNHFQLFNAQNKQLPPSVKLTTPTRHATLMQKANCWPTIFYGKVRAVSKTKVTGRQGMKDPKSSKGWGIQGISPIKLGFRCYGWQRRGMKCQAAGTLKFMTEAIVYLFCMRISSPTNTARMIPSPPQSHPAYPPPQSSPRQTRLPAPSQ